MGKSLFWPRQTPPSLVLLAMSTLSRSKSTEMGSPAWSEFSLNHKTEFRDMFISGQSIENWATNADNSLEASTYAPRILVRDSENRPNQRIIGNSTFAAKTDQALKSGSLTCFIRCASSREYVCVACGLNYLIHFPLNFSKIDGNTDLGPNAAILLNFRPCPARW